MKYALDFAVRLLISGPRSPLKSEGVTKLEGSINPVGGSLSAARTLADSDLFAFRFLTVHSAMQTAMATWKLIEVSNSFAALVIVLVSAAQRDSNEADKGIEWWTYKNSRDELSAINGSLLILLARRTSGFRVPSIVPCCRAFSANIQRSACCKIFPEFPEALRVIHTASLWWLRIG